MKVFSLIETQSTVSKLLCVVQATSYSESSNGGMKFVPQSTQTLIEHCLSISWTIFIGGANQTAVKFKRQRVYDFKLKYDNKTKISRTCILQLQFPKTRTSGYKPNCNLPSDCMRPSTECKNKSVRFKDLSILSLSLFSEDLAENFRVVGFNLQAQSVGRNKPAGSGILNNL